jgi:hypothetical protein
MLAKFNKRRAKRRFLMDASDRAVAHEEQITVEREARLARVPYHRPSSTPLYDQTRDTWGIDPSATATVDEMLRELDLLALPIVTGTLRGPVEGGAA